MAHKVERDCIAPSQTDTIPRKEGIRGEWNEMSNRRFVIALITWSNQLELPPRAHDGVLSGEQEYHAYI